MRSPIREVVSRSRLVRDALYAYDKSRDLTSRLFLQKLTGLLFACITGSKVKGVGLYQRRSPNDATDGISLIFLDIIVKNRLQLTYLNVRLESQLEVSLIA
jgi:hypothetical protein